MKIRALIISLATLLCMYACSKDNDLNIMEPSESQYVYSIAYSVGENYSEDYMYQFGPGVEKVANQYEEIMQNALDKAQHNLDDAVISACDAFYNTQDPQNSEVVFSIYIIKYIGELNKTANSWQTTVKQYHYGPTS